MVAQTEHPFRPAGRAILAATKLHRRQVQRDFRSIHAAAEVYGRQRIAIPDAAGKQLVWLIGLPLIRHGANRQPDLTVMRGDEIKGKVLQGWRQSSPVGGSLPVAQQGQDAKSGRQFMAKMLTTVPPP